MMFVPGFRRVVPVRVAPVYLLCALVAFVGCGEPAPSEQQEDAGVADDADVGDEDVEYFEEIVVDPIDDSDERELFECDAAPPQPPEGQRCVVEPGDSDRTLFYGTLLVDNDVYEDGALLVGDDTPNRRIDCAGCDCAEMDEAAEATVVSCPDAVISPGLINPHDHLTYAEGWPQPHGSERYDHRHDWRRGLRDHTQIDTHPRSGGHREVALYGELRMLFGGATSIAGSTGGTDASGLLRNLDDPDETEGLDGIDVDYRTFPLGDAGIPALRESGCDYPFIDDEYRVEDGIYLPHLSEGIDAAAQNELHCISGEHGPNLIRENTSIIHGIAVDARDVALIADRGANLVWSPRTNIDLYGNTAPVTLYDRFDVPISLGTDWSTSGSMNMLRELQCADFLNRHHFNDTFDDYELWEMATYNAALSLGAEHKLGSLQPGYVADITIFDAADLDRYRAVIDAEIDDIALVMRGGDPLYGDAELIEALVDSSDIDACEQLDVCDRERRACIELDIGETIEEIESEVHPDSYPLFFCDRPEDEPTCVPSRPQEYDGIRNSADRSGDGVPDVVDNCPDYFNPIRPMDPGRQANVNRTARGDVCDPCPLSEDPDCTEMDSDDWTGDGIPNDIDNCPYHYNPDQQDSSGDGIGDRCSPCPDHEITPETPCPGSIYDIKTGEVPPGEPVAVEDALVTATNPGEGLFVQIHPDDENYDGPHFSGLYVYLGFVGDDVLVDGFPEPGDRIDVSGTVQNFFDQLQLSDVQRVEITSSGESLPEPVVAEPEDLATGGDEQWELEGVLVEVHDVEVIETDVPPGPGDSAPTNEFIVDGWLHVNDFLHLVDPFPDRGDRFDSITGVLRWANANSKLEPRGEDDLELAPPRPERFEPETAYLDVGAGAEPVLELHLEREADEPMSFDFDIGDTDVLDGPDTVEFDTGEITQTIELDALVVPDAPVGVSATDDDGASAEAKVVVYDEDTERFVDSLDGPRQSFFTDEQWSLHAELNVPADEGGEQIDLSIEPVSDIDYPDQIELDEGERVAEFDIELTEQTGSFVAVVTHGDDVKTWPFEVHDPPEVTEETFAQFDASAGSYEDGQFVGDAGFAWEYFDARRAPASGAPAIEDTSLIFADSGERTLVAEEVPGGIESFSVQMKQAFSGSGPRQLELLIDGESVATSQMFGTDDDDAGEVFDFEVDDLEVKGDYQLEVRSVGTNQITIDNLQWTPLAPVDADELEFDAVNLEGFAPQPAFVEVEGDASIDLELLLETPALQEATIALDYGDPDAIDGPEEVDIQVGESATTIELEALESRENPVDIEATYDGDTITGQVHPFDDSTPRDIVAFDACPTALVDTTRSFEFQLDVPAGEEGLNLSVTADPEDRISSIPASLQLDEGETTDSFEAEYAQDGGEVTIELDTGDNTAEQLVDLTDATPPLVEDFSELGGTGPGYSDGDFTGNYGLEWSYFEAQRTLANAIDDQSLVLADDTASVQTGQVPGELSSFSVEMKKVFTNDDERQLELFVNGESRGTSQIFGDFNGEDDEVYTFEVDDLDISCVDSLEIHSVGSGQIVIDNITLSADGS